MGGGKNEVSRGVAAQQLSNGRNVVSAIAKPDLGGYKPDYCINLKGLHRG